jgi:adenine-specific DNA-methyltransferase
MKEIVNIEYLEEELPSEYADRLGIYYTKLVSPKHKKDNGQFFTPPPIAHLMASYCDLDINEIRILDPGCGTAILTCTLIENLISKNCNIYSISLVAYETDLELILYSKKVINYLKKWLEIKDIRFNYVLHNHDFILDNAKTIEESIFYNIEKFDVVISNPPYFKLAKSDSRAIAAKELVSGQSNIYSIFMGIASKLLNEKGQLIFITPRSFASGKYFRAFRAFFFNEVQLDKIHLFNSRKETFNRDKVLQETVILKAIKEDVDINKHTIVSSSVGLKDIYESKNRSFLNSELIKLNSKEKILYLPTNDKEVSILNLVNLWDDHLNDHNIQISTGPVVSFRSLDFIQDDDRNTGLLAPLFWLQNINKMILEWPKELKDKGQFIKIDQGSKNSLLLNKNYIFLRRFSTKDDKSRLIASPYFFNYTKSEYIGVENKVNYLYRKNGSLENNEVSGLCALLNSELFDIYFQIFNGNVNVSATELREMKFPSLYTIKEIGDKILLSNDYSMTNVNAIINEYFEMNIILK